MLVRNSVGKCVAMGAFGLKGTKKGFGLLPEMYTVPSDRRRAEEWYMRFTPSSSGTWKNLGLVGRE